MSYNEATKIEQLGVEQELLSKYGVVSAGCEPALATKCEEEVRYRYRNKSYRVRQAQIHTIINRREQFGLVLLLETVNLKRTNCSYRD